VALRKGPNQPEVGSREGGERKRQSETQDSETSRIILENGKNRNTLSLSFFLSLSVLVHFHCLQASWFHPQKG
jgi:hypothetical protein